MILALANIIAPDHCYNCGKIGRVLCDNCIYNIISEPYMRCIVCGRPTAAGSLCGQCRLPFGRAWVVGEREGALERLVDASKYESNRRGCNVQALLLDNTLPHLPQSTVVVPVPTIARHVRQRGYGHAERIAREFAQRRGLQYRPLLRRATTTVQQGATRPARRKQAAVAFYCDELIKAPEMVLLVDDVYTTGATAEFAAKTLRDAGVSEVWLAITTRQQLD